MKNLKRIVAVSVVCAVLILLLGQAQAGEAQGPQPRAPQTALGTAFSYQGQLKKNGSPYTGDCNFQFSLWDALSSGAQLGSTQSLNTVHVNGGSFAVTLDFGSQFDGSARWLGMAVQCTGDGGFTTLTPRTALDPVPYALYAGSAALADVAGTAKSADTAGYASTAGLADSAGTAKSADTAGYALSLAPGSVISGTGVLGLQVNTPNGNAIVGTSSANGYATIYGADASSTGGYAVYGNSSKGTGVTGNSNNGYGVWGTSNTSHGVVGTSTSGRGMWATSTNGPAIVAQSTYSTGVVVESAGWNGVTIESAQFEGISVKSSAYSGLYVGSAGTRGVWISAAGGNGVQVDTAGQNGVLAAGGAGYHGVLGINANANSIGVAGLANQAGSVGVWGQSDANTGVYGVTTSGKGVWGASTGSGSAGYFQGNVSVVGTLSKSAGSFRIDHPLDPENKYLSHSFVESPDMMNVYNGNVTTDANGDATIVLPAYFEALNKDFRYQLTVVGKQWAQARVEEEIQNNQFRIKTDKPNVKVSWQVTGIRHDPYAAQHPIVVEEDKPAGDRGTYLYPAGYGQSEERGFDYAHRPAKPSVPEQR